MSTPTLAPDGGGAVAPSSQGTTLIPRDEHEAICERLRAELSAANEIACTRRDEAASLRAQVAQLRAALESVSCESQNYHHRGDEKDHAAFAECIKIANEALASDGSELLDAVRGARDALALVYCDGCGSEAFPFRSGDHADASWGVRFTAVKAALTNLNSAIGREVSHE